MPHHITKYEYFLSNGILVVEFRSCYIFKNCIVGVYTMRLLSIHSNDDNACGGCFPKLNQILDYV